MYCTYHVIMAYTYLNVGEELVGFPGVESATK